MFYVSMFTGITKTAMPREIGLPPSLWMREIHTVPTARKRNVIHNISCVLFYSLFRINVGLVGFPRLFEGIRHR